MTGVSPLDHGILDFVQFDPQTGAKEPITSSLRRAPAIWNMASDGRQARRRARPVGHLSRRSGQRARSSRIGCSRFSSRKRRRRPASSSPPDRDQWARDALQHAEQSVDEAAREGVPAVAYRRRLQAGRRLRRSVRAAGQRAATHLDRHARLRRSRTQTSSPAIIPISPSCISRAPTRSAMSSRRSRRRASRRCRRRTTTAITTCRSATSARSTIAARRVPRGSRTRRTPC